MPCRSLEFRLAVALSRQNRGSESCQGHHQFNNLRELPEAVVSRFHNLAAGRTFTPVSGPSSVQQLVLQARLYVTERTDKGHKEVHEMAQLHPAHQEFVGCHVMTYLAFFKDDERKGLGFESWSGSLAKS